MEKRNAVKSIIISLSLVLPFTVAALTPEEALTFLYSTMSLPDSTDYSRQFYEDNIRASFRAREEMPWGKNVPDREFLHFVVPVRVNNENLDMSRPAFYAGLKDRVKGLSMAEAILEVNHWCHEKVTYRPSDGRTSSPLSSVSQAIGRCGEESTFTVAALRSVGIPARQIYTPRWAHTDDNHAWVEAWADGKWHFIGACEPEPVLDLAWFNDPASRGLLMSTNVAGVYNGPEEILLSEPRTTRINVTEHYAPTGTLEVRATYPDGSPVKDAKISFCIYNYSEFYPAVTKKGDADGRASLNAGLGDMLVWATDGERFGFAKGCAGSGLLTIVLDQNESSEGVFEFDITPPAPRRSQPAVTAAMREANNARFAHEDSIRMAYTSTFATPAKAREIAGRLGLDAESLSKVLVESRGNHAEITAMLESLAEPERVLALDLLLNVSEKDRRDIAMPVVRDHVSNAIPRDKLSKSVSSEIYNAYILSPRIESEGLRAWRGELSEMLAEANTPGTPEELAAWVKQNIADAEAANPLRLRMNPASVMKQRRADGLSRKIFFVAAARTLGIPARVNPVTAIPQYLDDNGTWRNVDLTGAGTQHESALPSDSNGTLKINFTPEGHMVDPKYYSQFSISKISDGVPRQLEYDENGTVTSIFGSPVSIEPGQYMLTSGQRLADGSVLARTEIFRVASEQNVSKELKIRQDNSALSVIGSLNAENIYHDIALNADKSILSTTGRGYYVLGLISPNHEPSAHVLNDLRAVAGRLEATGVKILLLFDSESDARRFKREEFAGLPENVVFGIDSGNASLRDICESLHLENPSRPLITVADTFNRIVWQSEGYTIGTGETLLSVLSRLK